MMERGRHDPSAARRWFAEDRRVTCHLRDERVVRAYDDPRWVYHDVLVALDESKGPNNGEPGLWARHFDSLAVQPRDDASWLHGAGWCLSKRELH